MPGLICPHCGTPTSFQIAEVPVKAHKQSEYYEFLQKRIKDNHAFSFAYVERNATDESEYAILECVTCSKRYVATKDYRKDWVASFPIPATRVAEEIPDKIRSAFQEAQLCYAIKAYQASLMMCRTTVIRLLRQQQAADLKSLHEQGEISLNLFLRANEVRKWANIVAHEDIPPNTISPEDCEELLVYMESLLNELYVAPAKLKRLTEKRTDISKGTKSE